MPEPLDARGGSQGKVSIRKREPSGNVSTSEMLLRGSIKKQTRELKELHEKARETDKLRRAFNSLLRKNRKLERERGALRVEVFHRREVGGLMSNVCANLSQQSWAVTDHDRENMRRLYQEWDQIKRAQDVDARP